MHVRFPNKEEDRRLIESLLSYISRPLEILESHTRITSDFSSADLLLSLFMEKWIDAPLK